MSPNGLMLQPLNIDTDVDLVAQLVRDSDVQATGKSESNRGRVLFNLTFPLAVRDEHRLALRDGKPVGVLIAECDPESCEAFVDISAVGDARAEVLAHLLDAARDFARRRAAHDPRAVPSDVDPFMLSAQFWQMPLIQRDGDEQCARLFSAAGLRMIRTFWTMRWDPPETVMAPPAPPGVARRVASSEEDLRTLHRLDQASFSDHFGFLHEDPFEVWMDIGRARPGFAPERWWIAEKDGEPVGFCLLEDSRLDEGAEYVGALGVIREARGQGIARWLLQCTAADAMARGIRAVTLNCDSENATNATALYESVGFTVRNQANLWNEPVTVNA